MRLQALSVAFALGCAATALGQAGGGGGGGAGGGAGAGGAGGVGGAAGGVGTAAGGQAGVVNTAPGAARIDEQPFIPDDPRFQDIPGNLVAPSQLPGNLVDPSIIPGNLVSPTPFPSNLFPAGVPTGFRNDMFIQNPQLALDQNLLLRNLRNDLMLQAGTFQDLSNGSLVSTTAATGLGVIGSVLRFPVLQQELGLSQNQVQSLNSLAQDALQRQNEAINQLRNANTATTASDTTTSNNSATSADSTAATTNSSNAANTGNTNANSKSTLTGNQQQQLQSTLADLQSQNLRQMSEILTPQQMTRLNQLRWRVLGPLALTEPEVSQAVGLSDDQLSQIQQLIGNFQQQTRQLSTIEASQLLSPDSFPFVNNGEFVMGAPVGDAATPVAGANESRGVQLAQATTSSNPNAGTGRLNPTTTGDLAPTGTGTDPAAPTDRTQPPGTARGILPPDRPVTQSASGNTAAATGTSRANATTADNAPIGTGTNPAAPTDRTQPPGTATGILSPDRPVTQSASGNTAATRPSAANATKGTTTVDNAPIGTGTNPAAPTDRTQPSNTRRGILSPDRPVLQGNGSSNSRTTANNAPIGTGTNPAAPTDRTQPPNTRRGVLPPDRPVTQGRANTAGSAAANATVGTGVTTSSPATNINGASAANGDQTSAAEVAANVNDDIINQDATNTAAPTNRNATVTLNGDTEVAVPVTSTGVRNGAGPADDPQTFSDHVRMNLHSQRYRALLERIRTRRLDEALEQLYSQIIGILTPSQMQQFNALLGPQFDLSSLSQMASLTGTPTTGAGSVNESGTAKPPASSDRAR